MQRTWMPSHGAVGDEVQEGKRCDCDWRAAIKGNYFARHQLQDHAQDRQNRKPQWQHIQTNVSGRHLSDSRRGAADPTEHAREDVIRWVRNGCVARRSRQSAPATQRTTRDGITTAESVFSLPSQTSISPVSIIQPSPQKADVTTSRWNQYVFSVYNAVRCFLPAHSTRARVSAVVKRKYITKVPQPTLFIEMTWRYGW